ncbi:hypothetical protein RCZ15_10270, partial [Capnocytophaga catalasegens]
IYLAHHNAI